MSPAGRAETADTEAGFTLIELVAVLAIVGIIAALSMPTWPRQTSATALRQLAMQTASVIKADRYAAIRQSRTVTTIIDPRAKEIRSAATGRRLRYPADVVLEAQAARACAGGGVSFYFDGRACGAVMSLRRGPIVYDISVTALTGEVRIDERRPS